MRILVFSGGSAMIARLKTTMLLAAGLLLFAHTAEAADIGRLFHSPEEAAAALGQAAQAKDVAAIAAILGPSSKDLIEFGDEVAQKQAIEEFSGAFLEHHHVASKNSKQLVLIVGNNGWPFPIPLVKQGSEWRFDTAAGREEILNRRIGENELNAIAVCRAYVEAQTEYAAIDVDGSGAAQFARKVVSSPGTKDGLFWPVKEGEKPSPFGPFIAQATSEGYTDRTAKPDPYHGYLFRILMAQGNSARGGKKSYIADGKMTGGFALIAYPASWGKSGIMTFIVNHDAEVFQKSLGPRTAEIASALTDYNPDRTWKSVKDDDDIAQ
jgi:hypothetical protein